MRQTRIINGSLIVALFCFTGYSADIVKDVIDEIKIVPKGYGSMEIGQIGQGFYKSAQGSNFEEIAHVWQERAFANLGFTARYRDRLRIDISGEGFMAFSTPQRPNYPTTLQTRQFFYIKSANALVSLGNPDFFLGNLQVGLFPYKYNPAVRNLGEYLFRSNPYPLVVYADFDYPLVDLLGARGNAQFLNKMIEIDLLLHSELLAHPVQDWSLSGVITSNLFRNSLSVGVGGSMYHIFSVYQGTYMKGAVDPFYYMKNIDSATIGLPSWSDTAIDRNAINVMTRFSFDIKKFLPLSIFGKHDLLLYGEMDILGLKKYSPYYDDIKERILWSFGFNIPGFKVIDLLNLEFEYCENRSAYADQLFYKNTKPNYQPMMLSTFGMKRIPWRWSLYIKKTFFEEHLGLIAQIARDHKKINFYYIEFAEMCFAEVLPTNEDWWWVFKTEFKF